MKSISKKRHKYNAQPQWVDGHYFASKAELKRYTELLFLEKAKQISGLKLQVTYKFVDGVSHRVDFEYLENGRTVVEDVKGFRTPVWKIKQKLFRHFYPDIEYRIV